MKGKINIMEILFWILIIILIILGIYVLFRSII